MSVNFSKLHFWLEFFGIPWGRSRVHWVGVFLEKPMAGEGYI